MRLLMLDDSANDLWQFARELRRIGPDVEITTATDEETFLAELDKAIPDATIIDAKLPRYSGLDALQAVRARCSDCPVILLTGDLTDEQTAEWIDKGFDRAIQKDRPAQLKSAVKRECERRAAERKQRDEDRKLEQERLREERFASLGQLATGIAHDMNNVLGVCLGAITFLRMHVQDPDENRVCDTAIESINHAAEMLRQICAFAKGSGSANGHKPVHAAQILSECAQWARAMITNPVCVESRIWPGTGMIDANETELHQLLINLIVNARDAMLPAGGTLTLEAQNWTLDTPLMTATGEAPAGNYVVFSVKDSGTGMDLDTQSKIFEPYFTTKADKGTGIGLAQVARIAREHGGVVRVQSFPGHGSEFMVLLPRTEQPPAVKTPRGNGEMLLLVDDEAALRMTTARLLQVENYRVIDVADGPAALSIFRARAPEIAAVITDLAMPIMDGQTLARELRKIRPEIPILYISGYGTPEDLNLQDGKILKKPFATEALLSAIHECIVGG